jgi:hypothetical protein
MHGDFSLNPLAYRDNVSRVLYQQGRVQLDSDVNELTETLLRATRALAIDTIGPHGGVDNSFEITGDGNDFQIAFGHYWIDGLQCVNPTDFWDALAAHPEKPLPATRPLEPPYFYPPPKSKNDGKLEPGLFYLDAFEHDISSAQDDTLRESALLGADTTSRAVVMWIVRKFNADETRRWLDLAAEFEKKLPRIHDRFYVALNLLLRPGARLSARATITEATDACVISPDARYRGTENRLFRVEVHTPGNANDATFKFSRDNGAEVYPISDLQGKSVVLDSLGRDHRSAIRVNDWVEVIDDDVLLQQKALPLRQVMTVDRHTRTITLDEEPEQSAGTNQELRPLLRRWEGPPQPIRMGGPKHHWIDLADGVQVQFSAAPGYVKVFRTGDYFLIPTRTATGDVIWPHDNTPKRNPLPVPPHGVHHRYAPLDEYGDNGAFTPRRKEFLPLPLLQQKP